MLQLRKIVILMIPVFILVSLFSTSAFAGKKKHKYWKKEKVSAYKNARNDYHEDWRDEIRYEQGHHHRGCNLPPGLAKKGKIPPGWAKKCQQQEVKHHAKKHHGHYPDHEHDHKRTSGGHDKPTVDGSVDIGVGIHIPFP
jgi:hypothetical protein